MPAWSRHLAILEINTWAWLWGLGRKYETPLTLDRVPPPEWDAIADGGFGAVWLMGVWERSPAGIAIANQNPGLLEDFRRALPDFTPDDNVGSPYSVRRYVVDAQLGGPAGLAIARKELAKRGMRLLLDFVPNHVAPDHPWVSTHPEYFIRGTEEDARKDPTSFLETGGCIYACGRDPYFPAWPDVLQLNAFQPALRQAARDTVLEIANQCDGIRCDMAMLMLNAIVERTHGERAGTAPATEYWADLIAGVRKSHADFLFIAEAYWDLESELQQLGFDFCYDKRLYDRLQHESAESVRLHLTASLAYQEKLVRFLENHDEPRAAAVFPPDRERAAAVAVSTLPGARLFHQGQFEGRKVRLPVFLRRMPDEPVDRTLQAFYAKLLKAANRPVFQSGQWRACECSGWPTDTSFQNLTAWSWTAGEDRYCVIINLSDATARARVHLPWDNLGGSNWGMSDILSEAVFVRDGGDVRDQGLYVELFAWNFHVLECFPLR